MGEEMVRCISGTTFSRRCGAMREVLTRELCPACEGRYARVPFMTAKCSTCMNTGYVQTWMALAEAVRLAHSEECRSVAGGRDRSA